MAFIEKGQEIDIEAIKAETQLSPEALSISQSWTLPLMKKICLKTLN